MDQTKMAAGAAFPDLSWKTVSGDDISPAQSSGWRLLIVYRGKHCPLCKKYLTTLNQLVGDFDAAGIQLMTLSADPQQKAASQVEETGLTFPVGYGLMPQQMRQLGLYISDPRSADETDRPFAEPAIFAINPKGQVQIVDISNAPFSRPDLQSLLDGLKFIISKDYPIRGRA